MEANEARPRNHRIGEFILVDESMNEATIHPNEGLAERELIESAADDVFFIAKIVRVVRLTNPAPVLEDL
jgi:hypothetical protein